MVQMAARRVRAIGFLVEAVATVCGPPAAHAAAPRLCPVLTDASGDATLYVGGVTPDAAGKGVVPSDPSLDVTAVDLSYTGRTLVASMKVAALSVANPQAPLGQYYSMSFGIGDAMLVLDGVVTPLGNRAWIGRADGSSVGGADTYAGQITANTVTNRVVLSASLADISRFATARKGTRLTHIATLTQRIV